MTGPLPPVVARLVSTVTYCEWPREPEAIPGDVLVMGTTGFVGRCIRLVTRSPWNHAVVVIDKDEGGLIVSQETPGGGDVFSYLKELDWTRLACISVTMDDAQRGAVVEFARWARGKRYGFLSLFGDLICAVTRINLALGIGTRMVCSTQTARALERSGWIPPKSPEAVTPADIGKAFGCQPK